MTVAVVAAASSPQEEQAAVDELVDGLEQLVVMPSVDLVGSPAEKSRVGFHQHGEKHSH
jgi:hypothetical protein